MLQGTGTHEIDHLGGLLKRMPWTAATFLVGAVAISGLPPLNGFVSEFLIFLGAFQGGAMLGRRRRRAVARADRRPRADWRIGGGVFHQGVRHCFSRRAAHRTRVAHTGGGLGHAFAHVAAGGRMRPHRFVCAVRCRSFAGGSGEHDGAAARSRPRKPCRRGRPAGIGCDGNGRIPAGAGCAGSAAPRFAGRPPGGGGRHLGMRLRAADRTDAIHRFLLCPAGHDVVPLAARHSSPGCSVRRASCRQMLR